MGANFNRSKKHTRVDQNVCAGPLYTQNFTAGMGIIRESWAITNKFNTYTTVLFKVPKFLAFPQLKIVAWGPCSLLVEFEF